MRADSRITIRPWRISVGALLAFLFLFAAVPLAHAADTVVSLEFDDATADQAAARSMLASRNMHATFFVNSGTIGAASGFHLSWNQLHDLAADGNEITGHTVNHANLPQTQSDLDEARREICNDRATLLNEGFDARNFAYPYGAYDETSKQLAADCGYNSARDVSGVYDPVTCDDCPYAETIPPRDPFRTRTTENIKATTTLAEIQASVTAAEQNGGGWVQLVLHHICNGCGQQYSITQSDFAALLDWLAARPATTSVKTVQEVIGGPLKPAVAGPAPTPPSGPNLVRNPSVENADVNGNPTCWDPVGFGNNSASFTRTTDSHSGLYAERLAVTNYVSGAQRMFVHMDLGRCAPTVTAGNNYTIGAYYKSTARPAFEVYVRDSRGLWRWWMTTASFDPATSWDRATFTTPSVPAGTTAISFALGIQAAGTLTTDDYSLVDRGVIPPPANTLQNASLETFPNTTTVDPTCWGSGGSATGTWARTTDAHSGGNAEVATITASPTGSQDKKIVSQQDSTVLNPTLTSATGSSSGGTLADGSYHYVITAFNSRGETLASAERSATTSGTSSSVALAWPAVSGATGYRIYRSSAPGQETLLASVGAVTSYTDTGSQTPGTTTPPVSNTAVKVTPCAPVAKAGHAYQLGAWYKTSSGASARLIVYYRDAAGNWVFWKAQPIAASTTWTQATTVTDAVPPGATALSMGISLLSTGTLTTDDLSLGDLTQAAADNPPPCDASLCDSTAPGSSALSPALSNTSNLSISYTAADESGGSGLSRVDLYAKRPNDIGYTLVRSDSAPGTSGSFDYLAAIDGEYSFYTLATDRAGNTEGAPAGRESMTRVDTGRPTSSAAAPATSSSSQLTVSYNAADNSGGAGLAAVDLYAKAPGDSSYARVATDSAPSSSGSFNYVATAGDGDYSFYTLALDKAGNAEAAKGSAETTTSVLDDSTAPTSSATAPPLSDSTALTVAYTAGDGSGLAKVDLYVKGPGDSGYAQVASDGSPADSGSFSYTAGNGDGTYAFYTRGTDVAGNVEPAPADADASTLVDTTAPVTSAGAPATATEAPVTVSYTASDPSPGSGLVTVDLYVRAPGQASYAKTASDASPAGSGSFAYTPDAGTGDYSFYTLAVDEAGNGEVAPSTPDATTSYAVDATPPTSSASPLATYTSTTGLTVAYTAADDTGGSGLASVELWARAPGASGFVKAATNSGGSSSGSFSYTAAAGDGAYAFYTVAVDAKGNRQATPASAQASTTVDTAGPGAFQMTAPAAYLSASVTLALSSTPTDATSGVATVTYQHRRSGASSWSTACSVAAAPWSCRWSTSASTTPDGVYELRAVASDRAGNTTVASNTPLTRTVKNTKPTPRSIGTANVTGGTSGRINSGDSATFTYSDTMASGSILAGWTGSAVAVQVRITAGAAKKNDTLTIWRANGSATIALANPLDLGGKYVTANTVLGGTMVQSGAAVTVTLGALQSGGLQATRVTGGTLVWSPDTRATDLAGNTTTNTTVSAAGPAF